MDAELIQTAVRGAAYFGKKSQAASTPQLANDASPRAAARATLRAAGFNALRDDSLRVETNAAYKIIRDRAVNVKTQESFRKNGADVAFMPTDVADAALDVLRIYLEDDCKPYRDDLTDEYYFNLDAKKASFDRTSFSAAVFLTKFAQAKVAFPPESCQKFVKLLGKIRTPKLNRQLVETVGGYAARRSALCEYDLNTASRLARYFYARGETPTQFSKELVEAALPKKKRGNLTPFLQTLEFEMFLDPAKARDYLCAFPRRPVPTAMIRALSALALDLKPEDSDQIEKIIVKSSNYAAKNVSFQDAFEPLLDYARRLLVKTGADTDFRRQAFADAKEFAHSQNENYENALTYVPLVEWESIFQMTPRQILRFGGTAKQRQKILSQARVSYLTFGAPKNWEYELAQPDESGFNDQYLQFLSNILRVKYCASDFARFVVDSYLNASSFSKALITPYTFLIIAAFEPYPWRDELGKELSQTLTNMTLSRIPVVAPQYWGAPVESFYSGKLLAFVNLLKKLFPWLPDLHRTKVLKFVKEWTTLDLTDLAYRSPRARSSVFTQACCVETEIIRNYLQQRAKDL